MLPSRPRITGRCSLIAAGVVVLCIGAYALGLRINVSYSLPLGLYWVTSSTDSPLVEFCPDGRHAIESSERNYRGFGFACPDGHVPLLKPVVARPGDHVETTEDGLIVNGILLAQTAPLTSDGARRPLTPWPFGEYTVAPGTIWVASTHNRGSYDSRYMGPIAVSQIRSRLRPIWTF